MESIWLICCAREAYSGIRSEIAERCDAQRFMRINAQDNIARIVEGFKKESLCAAVDVGPDETSIAPAEHVIAELAGTGCLHELLAFVDPLDAGVAARCFHAGATEVIAAGAAKCGSKAARQVCIKEENNACSAAKFAGLVTPACDDLDEPSMYEDTWEEMPPWDMSCNQDNVSDYSDEEAYASSVRGAVGTATGMRPGARENCARKELVKQPQTAFQNAQSASASSMWQKIEAQKAQALSRQTGEVQSTGVQSTKTQKAPVVTAISGRGGVGKTTLVAAMAACAARAGLRAAVLDLDLMFGNLAELLGVESVRGIEDVGLHADSYGLAERDVEGTAMRIGPGLTVWGPCAAPERAELCAASIEQLLKVLCGVADVVFVDTSGFWGDAVAMAVSCCDRCLIVGGNGTSAAASGKRAVELAARLGVPRTRMTCVVNRMGARTLGEEQALAFEMGTALRSCARIMDGGDDVSSMISFGQMNGLVAGSSAFASSVRGFTNELLQELGCPLAQWLLAEEQRRNAKEEHGRFRLPWRRQAGDVL